MEVDAHPVAINSAVNHVNTERKGRLSLITRNGSVLKKKPQQMHMYWENPTIGVFCLVF